MAGTFPLKIANAEHPDMMERSPLRGEPLGPVMSASAAPVIPFLESLPDGLPELVVGIGTALKCITLSVASQLDRRLVEHGLTYSEWVPVYELVQRPRRTVAELARALQITSSGMTRTLDRLEEKKLITRARSSEDRRIVTLSLTDAGRRAAAVGPEVLGQVLDLHLAGFDESERLSLLDFLERLRRNGDALGRARRRCTRRSPSKRG